MQAAKSIGVLTFHRCINYGSYWQARCLVEGLRARGHRAELLDHDCPEVRRAEWRCAFQPQLPVRTPRVDYRRYAAKTRRFLSAFDALPQSPRFALDAPEQSRAYDLVMVGSDEVWNFRHPWYGGKGIFFGDGLNAPRVVSYAASFGNHDADEGMHPHWADKLRRFDAIAVRDENSQRLIRDGLGVDPTMVLDPCLQFPHVVPADEGAEPPYLALYGHGFPAWFEQRVRAAADARGWRVVSIGYHNDWADEQAIEAGPADFPRLIANARAVATNFFHGSVFALANGKPFVCTASAYRRNKLRDLTQSVGAGAHLIEEQASSAEVAALLTRPLDAAIPGAIERLRAQSDAYLETVLA